MITVYMQEAHGSPFILLNNASAALRANGQEKEANAMWSSINKVHQNSSTPNYSAIMSIIKRYVEVK
jgi:hypothetical protein